MMWETAGVIAEIVAAIAVLVSLWYLAIQIKQNTELERAGLEVQLGLTWAEVHDNMIQNPSLARAYDLAADHWDELSDEDKQIATFGLSIAEEGIRVVPVAEMFEK